MLTLSLEASIEAKEPCKTLECLDSCESLDCIDFNNYGYDYAKKTGEIYQQIKNAASGCKDKFKMRAIIEESTSIKGKTASQEGMSEFIEEEFMKNPTCILNMMKEISPEARKEVASYLSIPTYIHGTKIGAVIDKYKDEFPEEYALIRPTQQKVWTESFEYPRWENDRLKSISWGKSINYKSKYIHYDFSPLLMPKSEFIGYIEPNYGSLKLIFTSINKDSKNQDQYKVKGYSVVKGNKCDFEGEIKITQISEYEKIQYGTEGAKLQGLLMADYKFNEDKAQKFSGIFEGVMTLFWYVDKDGQIKYFDEQSFLDKYKKNKYYSAKYSNNQYIGTWLQYGKETKKVANWGEYRVPFPGT